MFRLWLTSVFLLFGSYHYAAANISSTAEGNNHCLGYVYKLNTSLAEVKCPVVTCGLDASREQHQIITWEIQPARGSPSLRYCSKTVIRSDGYFEWHEVNHQDVVVYTADNVTNTTLSTCQTAVTIQGVDPNSGSLVLYSSIYTTYRDMFHTANARCTVYQETCNSSKSMQITVPARNSIDSINYRLSNPLLSSVTREVQNVNAMWQVGSLRYLCISTLVKNPAASHWEQNGRELNAKTVRADDLCVDCHSEQCIRQAERLHGDQKGGGAEVLQVTWSDPCEVDSENIQMMSLLRVSNVSMETTGVYAFRQDLRLIQYHVTVDWLRETSFVEEPSRELTVPEGHSLHVPCIISTAVDANLSQIYWSGPQGLITGISSVEATSRPEMVCEQNHVDVGRVFYVQMNTQVHSDAGTLAQVSIELHICNAEQQDSGVYRCGVWTGESNRNVRGVSLTVESTPDDHTVTVAALSVVAFALFVILAVLIALLSWCVCERYQRVQHCLCRMHLQPMPPTKRCDALPSPLIPHDYVQTHVC